MVLGARGQGRASVMHDGNFNHLLFRESTGLLLYIFGFYFENCLSRLTLFPVFLLQVARLLVFIFQKVKKKNDVEPRMSIDPK